MIDQLHDREAERAVLAAMLQSELARQEARRHITGADMHEPVHERLWDAMTRLDKHDKPVDPVTVLAVVRNDRPLTDILPDIVTTIAFPDAVGDHAEIVRAWAMRRRINTAATKAMQQALNPDLNPTGFAASVATEFASIRDSGVADEVTAETIDELLEGPDDEQNWLVPGLLERRDRFMLTGEEGLGKSHLLRQLAVLAACGLHPFDNSRVRPLRALVIDCENTRNQVRRKIRPVYDFACHHGLAAGPRLMVDCTHRLDLARDKDLAKIHHLLDAQQPDLVVIGPLYRLAPRALQTDDEAGPVLAALDTIRDRDIALLIEAHAGHTVGKGGIRDLRPRGSSSLLGWPEFGYGLRATSESSCDVVPWRGDRDERDWPSSLRRASDGLRWVRDDGRQVWAS